MPTIVATNMNTFKQTLSEVMSNQSRPDRGLPEGLKPNMKEINKHGFTTAISITGKHTIFTTHGESSAPSVTHPLSGTTHRWVNNKTGHVDFMVEADTHKGKNPGERIYNKISTYGVPGGKMGHHAYFDLMSGRTRGPSDPTGKTYPPHEAAIMVHDNQSKGATKLRQNVRKHYGDKVLYHTYDEDAEEAKHLTHGVTSNFGQKIPVEKTTPYSLHKKIGPMKIVGMVPPKHRYKLKKDNINEVFSNGIDNEGKMDPSFTNKKFDHEDFKRDLKTGSNSSRSETIHHYSWPSSTGEHTVHSFHVKHDYHDPRDKIYNKEEVTHIWVDKQKKPKFRLDASLKNAKRPEGSGEKLYRSLHAYGAGAGIGHHAYFDLMSGRAGHAAIMVHDDQSKGATKLRQNIRKHYGDKVLYHTYEHDSQEAKHLTHGVTVSHNTPEPFANKHADTRIVGLVPKKYRVKHEQITSHSHEKSPAWPIRENIYRRAAALLLERR